MPTNKNAMTRYEILDELLSNRYHNYTIDGLVDEVNRRLQEIGRRPVTRRCVEMDIEYIELSGPFMAEIERIPVTVFSAEHQKNITTKYIRYKDPSFSIFKKKMTDDEKYLLSNALDMLGQFDGLPNFEALQQLHKSLDVREHRQIVSFTKNPLENTSLFGELFTAISQKQVIKLHYFKFGEENKDLISVLHPYLLKEYNRRWYLIAATDAGKILNFSLDRIHSVEPLPSMVFHEYEGNFNERFEDIVGVTYYEANPVEHIVFWVSDFSRQYVVTKPIHESQKSYSGERERGMREMHPSLSGGAFFSIDCMENYELIRELSSFGPDLVVLSPANIQKKICDRITQMIQCYSSLRT